MEIKEAEKIVIAKPVAWRPGISKFKSFSELLSDAVDASPPVPYSETLVAAIKPRTRRFKPVCNSGFVAAETVASATSDDPSNKVPEPNVVVYKPIARLVSKTTVSLLANMGCKVTVPQVENTENAANIQPLDEVKHQDELKSDLNQDFPLQLEKKENVVQDQVSENDKVSFSVPENGDQTGYDGHNWRKYGQKQVKGSEYPRSYYKCTYPNCPVKKKVERMEDGQIAEIVYKGEHNHSKPPPPIKYTPPDGQVQRLASGASQDEVKNPSWKNQPDERIEGHHGKSEQCHNIEPSLRPSFYRAAPPINNASVSISNNNIGLSRDFEEETEALEGEGVNFKSKRRKSENQSVKVGSTEGEATDTVEPRVVVEKNTDSEMTGDGFRWRKYGQKVVKGNIYPRSYYRCTSLKCNVRKYVERTSEDTHSFITTYEGRHNHDMPTRGTASEAFKTSCKKKT